MSRLKFRVFSARTPQLTAVLMGLLAFVIAPLATVPPAAAQSFQTLAPHAILLDAESGTVLFEKEADELVRAGQHGQDS